MRKKNIFKTILLTSIISLIFTSCSNTTNEEEWTSFVYPDKQNQKRSIKVGVYKSYKECKKASQEKLLDIKANELGFYKCGLGCIFHEGMKNDICTKMK